MKHQASADRCDPSRSHVLGCQHWTRVATQANKHILLGAQALHLFFLLPRPICVTFFIVPGINHQVTAVYVILCVLMFSAVSTGLELRTKLINTPFLVPKVGTWKQKFGQEVVHILNCAFAHEAPSNSSICDPSRTHVLGCQHWTRAATQSDKHTFLGARLDHTTRGIKGRTYSWSLVSNTGLG
ncbi:hypothetical protein KY284_003089 [Solanum tuberosum]|nr:hypothetical protein KY284_003089 [Solanum tuberosum]